MVNITITVKIDKFGKIFLPKRIRRKLTAEKFEVRVEEGVIELIPVKSPLELFGTLKSIDMSVLDEIHGEDHEFGA